MWKDVRMEARDLRQPLGMTEPIQGFDHDPVAVRLSEKSAAEAGVSGDIQFRIQEISELRSSREYGVIVCNPPYGERMGSPEEVEAVYRDVLACLRFTADLELLRDHIEYLVRKAFRLPMPRVGENSTMAAWNVSSTSTWRTAPAFATLKTWRLAIRRMLF